MTQDLGGYSCFFWERCLFGHMAALIRLATVALFALLLQFSAGGAVNAGVVAYATAGYAVNNDVPETVAISAFDSVGLNGATSTDGCQSGKCGGLTCHCTCHGIAGALPLAQCGLLYVPKATPSSAPNQYFAAITLLPPVPPPQA